MVIAEPCTNCASIQDDLERTWISAGRPKIINDDTLLPVSIACVPIQNYPPLTAGAEQQWQETQEWCAA